MDIDNPFKGGGYLLGKDRYCNNLEYDYSSIFYYRLEVVVGTPSWDVPPDTKDPGNERIRNRQFYPVKLSSQLPKLVENEQFEFEKKIAIFFINIF